MPKLLKHLDGEWRICEDTQATYLSLADWHPGEALEVGVDAEPTPTWLEALSIAVNFPAMTDGRGLSLAVLLRKRLGYTGELVARGNVHEDIVHFLARCGFNTIELANESRLDTALKWVDLHTGYYQASVISNESALKRAN
jgi:uncharacterized protein (DUF934 family)